MMLFADGAAGDVATSETIKGFVNGIISAVTDKITLTDIGVVLAAIIAAVIVIFFAWKFGRKGFGAIKSALSGKGVRM